MNRHTAPTLAAAALTIALAACAPATGNTSSGNTLATAAATTTTTATATAATPTCTPDFGSDGTGINNFAGTITATVTLDCNATPDDSGLISLTLVRQAPGSSTPTAAAAKGYQHTALSYDTEAPCAPGTYALHILYGVTVNHHALADQIWGKQVTITAGDCS